MISLSCPACGGHLKVREDFAGKKVRCPTCKETLQVPTPPAAHPPVAHFTTDEATIPPRLAPDLSESTTVPPALSPIAHIATFAAVEPEPSNGETAEDVKAEIVYRVSSEIARGGMGAIMRAVDQDIHREVAVKFLLNAADARQKARFIEEAQITGQLEHPNIVPIHQLGVHEDGRCFFSMKMVKGRSLAEILKEEKNGLTLGRLLTIFVSICNAVSYAHSRRVIHRDLKPANVMVGDFGEVYVMDWGLAKVKDEGGSTKEDRGPSRASSFRPHAATLPSVSTHRQREGELTQAGAIMGTPAYMPPEQARGGDVDERADIYSLGAILYEILTLTPPVGRSSDMVAVLMHVIEGQIDSPKQRAPARAKAGWIPPELSAIAKKALAKDRGDRYQNVDALKRDVELFLEGRSVSAKQDTIREQLWKLVKRNKTASLISATATVLLTVVLAWSWWNNHRAYQETEKANQGLVAEKEQKNLRTQRAIPAFVQAAHTLAAQGKFDDALSQLDFTLEYDPKHAEARFYKGRLLIAQKKFAAGRAELEKYLELKPKDFEARALVRLCAPDLKDDLKFRAALVGVFQRQGEYTIAARLLEDKRDELEARKLLLATYKAQVEKKWPGMGQYFSMRDNGLIGMDIRDLQQVKSLEHLRGLQLEFLWLMRCPQLTDLSPLKDMPLVFLDLTECPIKDFSPLATMPLEWLSLQETGVHDLSMLKGMMTLRTLTLSGNPKIDDLTPLKGLELITLDLKNCQQVQDLRPLAGMPLRTLHLGIGGSRLKGFAPLAELKDLKNLYMGNLPIWDKGFSNVKDLRLKDLDISGTKIQSLAPLKDMKLTKINLSLDQITPANISILRAMTSLETVVVNGETHRATGFYKRYDAGDFKK